MIDKTTKIDKKKFKKPCNSTNRLGKPCSNLATHIVHDCDYSHMYLCNEHFDRYVATEYLQVLEVLGKSWLFKTVVMWCKKKYESKKR